MKSTDSNEPILSIFSHMQPIHDHEQCSVPQRGEQDAGSQAIQSLAILG